MHMLIIFPALYYKHNLLFYNNKCALKLFNALIGDMYYK